VQISAEISDGAPGQRALKKTGNQYDTGEGIGQHRGIAAECAARPATAGFAGLRIDREFEDQTGRCGGEQPGEHKEDVAPAKQVAELCRSAATCGNSESITRTWAWLAKPATARRMIDRVGFGRGSELDGE